MSRMMLMQSILGHMALLAEQHPKKAASPVAREAKRIAKMTLRDRCSPSKPALRRAA